MANEKDNKNDNANIDEGVTENEAIGNETPNEIKKETINLKDVVVDIEQEKEDTKDENITIKKSSSGLNNLKKFIGGKTKEHDLAEDKEGEEKEGEKPANDDGELIGKYISEDEYKLIASVLITLIDTVIVNLFKFWSGDMRDSSFGLPKGKRNELAEILAKILKKRNVKWSLELLFVFMLVLGYAQNAKQAYEFRKDKKISGEALKVVKKTKITDEDGKTYEASESTINKEEKRGRPPKFKRHVPKKVEEKENLYENSEEVSEAA